VIRHKDRRLQSSSGHPEDIDVPHAPTSQDRSSPNEMACPECGAYLKYEPGTTHLKCPYCASEFPIEQERPQIQEMDYHDTIASLEQGSETEETFAVKCSGCGAEIVLDANVTSAVCPYCATSLIVDQRVSKKAIKPRYVLPFDVNAKQTRDLFRNWINSLWFAPGSLKQLARTDAPVSGIYVPYWTYDAATSSLYSGARGDFYYEPVTVVVEREGRLVEETRMVQKIAWTPVQGRVDLRFDDMLILASTSLRTDYAEALEPWDLTNLAAYDDRYMSGFLSENYQIGPVQGFDAAKNHMMPQIIVAVRQDIGGDTQQVHSLETEYAEITFKHILLPVWINTYRYGNRRYSFLVNARTGEVQGERPWSAIKIALFALAMTAAAFIIGSLLSQSP